MMRHSDSMNENEKERKKENGCLSENQANLTESGIIYKNFFSERARRENIIEHLQTKNKNKTEKMFFIHSFIFSLFLFFSTLQLSIRKKMISCVCFKPLGIFFKKEISNLEICFQKKNLPKIILSVNLSISLISIFDMII